MRQKTKLNSSGNDAFDTAVEAEKNGKSFQLLVPTLAHILLTASRHRRCWTDHPEQCGVQQLEPCFVVGTGGTDRDICVTILISKTYTTGASRKVAAQQVFSI